MAARPGIGAKLLLIIAITIQLDLLQAGQVARPQKARTTRAQHKHHSSDINSGCDLLFAASGGGNTGSAQDYCQCRDSDPIEQLAPGPGGELLNLSLPTFVPISQLDCRHGNASELLTALSRALAGSGPIFKLDYLSIQTNVTYGDSGWHNALPTRRARAQVDQLTATIALAGGDARASSIAETVLSTLASELFEPDRLQSLTLVIIDQVAATHSATESKPVKLNHLLGKLTGLSRLEISVSDEHAHHHGPATPPRLELDSTSLSAQTRGLQWLNLASNSNLSLLAAPLARLPALEYLNLESSHLSAFHLYDHFVTTTTTTTTEGRPHSNLSSLSLARNELGSLERDLFCCSSRQVDAAHLFRLPSLSQLDLSHNRLTSIGTREARSILSHFPQLANLYLQHNQLKHLNLSPLLGTDWRHLAREQKNMTSKLEFIDLSHNELVALTAFSQVAGQTPDGPRLRSINLAHNRLRRPISLIDPRLVDLLSFAETSSVELLQQQPDMIISPLDTSIGSTIFDLTGASDRSETTNITTCLCDYLSIGRLAPDTMPSATDDESVFLIELLLEHNQIAQLESGDLSGSSCRGLETLVLNDNSLAHIARGALDSLAHLQRLDLSANQLIEIPTGLFDHLPELRVLNLAANKLTSSVHLPLVRLANLHELYLQDNSLESLHVLGSNATNLRRLDLARNKLAHLPVNAFTHLSQLIHLSLAGNKQLKEFNWPVLFSRPTATSSQLDELRTDNLSDQKRDKKSNRRKKVQRKQVAQRRRSARSSAAGVQDDQDDDGLGYTQSAEMTNYLNLRDNRLVSFGPPAVAATIRCDLVSISLLTIQVLDLSHNSIKELANNSLACFRHLELLDLSFNHLRTLNEFALDKLTHLKHLSVASNYLMHANGDHRLRHFDLSGNQLNSFRWSVPGDDDDGPAASGELEHLNLSDNYNLKLDSSELLALLAASSNTLRQLKLARIASIWTNDLETNASARAQFDLELESLDLGQVTRVDPRFWQYFTSPVRLRAEKLALCPPTQQRENFTLARWLSEDTKLRLELDLSRCQLTSNSMRQLLAAHKNVSLATVVRVNLSHNKLSEWPPLVVSPHSIVHLDLSHNKLTGRLFRPQEADQTVQLDQLEYLNLSSNALTSLCGGGGEDESADDQQCKQVVADSMPRLRHLDLSHNKLKTLPSDLLDQWQHLEMVWLRHNQLTLVAPPHGAGRGQHVIVASSRLRLLDLSCQGQLPAAPSHANWQAASKELKDDLLEIIARPPSDLIIYKDEERAVIECSHLSEFTRRARDRSSAMRWYASENEQDYLGDDRQSASQAVVTCPMLLRELRLDNFTWSNIDFAGSTPSLVALSLTGNRIRTIGEISSRLTPRSRARVVHLDLSRNAIESVALDEICAHFPNLQALEMAHQANLQEVELARVCTSLAHINLSNNMLRSIKSSGHKLDSVLVLRLDHNHLRDLDEDLLLSLPNLRHLDLRFNQLAQMTDHILTSAYLTNPLLDLVLAAHQRPHVNVNRYKVQLTRDMSALAISSSSSSGFKTKTSNQTFGLEVSGLDYSDRRHVIVSKQWNSNQSIVLRFCTLNRAELHRVCLRSEPEVVGHRRVVCFALKPPTHGPSCTTNIADQDQLGPNLTALQTRTESLMSSGDLSTTTTTTTTTKKSMSSTGDKQHADDADPVLSFIDYLKWAWLRAKQFDLAAYLAQVSQVKQDSVLVTLNGRHPIYTLTVIKLGLVLAALCVILLSIAMFALLTATVIGGGGGGGGSASSKRQKLRRQNKVVASDQESVESSCGHAGSKGQDDETTTTTTTSGGGATKSRDTSEVSRCSRHTSATTASSNSTTGSGALDTVREAEHKLQVAAAGGIIGAQQHAHQQLMFQQNCSTPSSSSLAPSSVETGETMQAVDSLQSCSFTRAQRQEIYDSQRTLTATSGQAHFNSVDQYQQHESAGAHLAPPAPVATVMRMVKSSTFDGASVAPIDFASSSGFSAAAEAQQRGYGTLRNLRHLYSAGASASFNYPALARQQAPAPPSRTLMRSGGGELDPATLSLLSLNSQLSGGGQLPGGGEQVTGQASAAASLCQYHTRQQAMQRARDQQQPQQDQRRELLLLAGQLQPSCQRHSSAAMSANTNGTLFELEEDQLQPATDWHGGPEQQQDPDYPLAPPPPPPL